MRVLVTGACGQLGTDVMRELVNRGFEGIGSDIGYNLNGVTNARYILLDITDRNAVFNAMAQLQPEAVIHCAAWTAVDDAEEPYNFSKVYAINVEGTRNVVYACQKFDCKMIYLSTDYVFSGEGSDPWRPEEVNFKPINNYGRTKLEGERSVMEYIEKYYIVRISWLFGNTGHNFVKTMLNLGKSNNSVRVVNDQIGTPTYTVDLAKLLVDMAATDKYGIYHVSNEGQYISWYDFACEIFKQAGIHAEVFPVNSRDYRGSKARRPLNSRLDKSKLIQNGFDLLPDWCDALRRYIHSQSK